MKKPFALSLNGKAHSSHKTKEEALAAGKQFNANKLKSGIAGTRPSHMIVFRYEFPNPAKIVHEE